MSGLLITLPIAAVIALVFLVFFLWSVRNEDYEDSEMIKYRMLMDENDQADKSVGSEPTTVSRTSPPEDGPPQ